MVVARRPIANPERPGGGRFGSGARLDAPRTELAPSLYTKAGLA